MQLNEKGQCPVCKKKPLRYKTPPFRGYYCTGCDRAFDYDTGEWKKNHVWESPLVKKPIKHVEVGKDIPETTESFL